MSRRWSRAGGSKPDPIIHQEKSWSHGQGRPQVGLTFEGKSRGPSSANVLNVAPGGSSRIDFTAVRGHRPEVDHRAYNLERHHEVPFRASGRGIHRRARALAIVGGIFSRRLPVGLTKYINIASGL